MIYIYTACPNGKAGSGGTCAPCQAGKVPNDNKSQCSACPEGKADLDSTATTPCTRCPAGFGAAPNGTACIDVDEY